MLLTISERFALSSILPPTGDILTLKDIRQLKEDLAISQEDRKEVQFVKEYKCPECDTKDTFSASVKCGKCDVWMTPTGQIGCTNWDYVIEINIPDSVTEVIITTLRKMNDDKKLEERHISIYEKFVGKEKDETN